MNSKGLIILFGLIIIGGAVFLGYYIGVNSDTKSENSDPCSIESVEDAFTNFVTVIDYKVNPHNTKGKYKQESSCKWYVEILDVDGVNKAFYIEHTGVSEEGSNQYSISATLPDLPDFFTSSEEENGNSEMQGIDLTREQLCNEITVEENFRYWMDFKYPDWKIYDDIVIVSSGDCSYNLRFTTINPHLSKFGMEEKSIIVAQFDYTNNYEEFSVKILRGTLY